MTAPPAVVFKSEPEEIPEMAKAVVVAFVVKRLPIEAAVEEANGMMDAIVEVETILPARKMLPWMESAEPGVVVPIPTFTAFAPVPPRTRQLEQPTMAPAPMAVEVERLPAAALENAPINVVEVPVVRLLPAE
jgi:hypothetical protein